MKSYLKTILKVIPIAVALGLLGHLLYPVVYLGGLYKNTLSVRATNSDLERKSAIEIVITRESPFSGEFSLDLKVDDFTLPNVQMIDLGDKFFLLGQSQEKISSTTVNCQVVLAVGMLTKVSLNKYLLDLNYASVCTGSENLVAFKLNGKLNRQIDREDPLVHLFKLK